MKILVDQPSRVPATALLDEAYRNYGPAAPTAHPGWREAVSEFLADRELYLFERRGFRPDEGRAVIGGWERPHAALRRVEALAHARKSPEFERLAVLFKRAKNITRDVPRANGHDLASVRGVLREPSELGLLEEMQRRWPVVARALEHERYLEAMNEVAQLHAPVDKFFVDVLVMAEDPALRQARLELVASLRDTILDIADIAEIAPETA